jgi:hypothetical protein
MSQRARFTPPINPFFEFFVNVTAALIMLFLFLGIVIIEIGIPAAVLCLCYLGLRRLLG